MQDDGAVAVSPIAQSRLMLVEEVAEYLGISERTVWREVAAERLPCVRIGRSARFDPHDVFRYVARQKG